MSERLFYKGFTSTPRYSAEDDAFFGLLDVPDAVVIYDSETATGLKQAFVDAVEDYLEMCAENGVEPSGRAMALA